MNPKWLALAGEFLESAGDALSDRGCSDWRWPAGWSDQDRIELMVAMVSANTGREPRQFTESDRDEITERILSDRGPPDWWVAAFLAMKLKEGARD